MRYVIKTTAKTTSYVENVTVNLAVNFKCLLAAISSCHFTSVCLVSLFSCPSSVRRENQILGYFVETWMDMERHGTLNMGFDARVDVENNVYDDTYTYLKKIDKEQEITRLLHSLE